MNASIVIVAGGMSKRMKNSTPKPFIKLGSKPILLHALEKFQRLPFQSEIILVLPEKHIRWAINKFGKAFAKLGVKKVVAGGKLRQDSVRQGFNASDRGTKLVVIHDAARPLVDREIIIKVAKAAYRNGSAIAAIPASDTIKEVAGRKIRKTLNRRHIWLAQTPQAFRRQIFSKALNRISNKTIATDDSFLVENLGKKVTVVEASSENIKITTSKDLVIAKAILGMG